MIHHLEHFTIDYIVQEVTLILYKKRFLNIAGAPKFSPKRILTILVGSGGGGGERQEPLRHCRLASNSNREEENHHHGNNTSQIPWHTPTSTLVPLWYSEIHDVARW